MKERPGPTPRSKNEAEKHLVINEAPITVTTGKGHRKKYPVGSVFAVLSSPIVTESGLPSNVMVHFHQKGEEWILSETEPSLRHKIVRAEMRQWWFRSIVVGLSIGVSIELAGRAITFLANL